VQVKDKRNLNRLCQVSKTLHTLTTPRLYETLLIPAKDEFSLERVETALLLRTFSEKPKFLDYVKAIRIVSTFHKNLDDERCVHWLEGNEGFDGCGLVSSMGCHSSNPALFSRRKPGKTTVIITPHHVIEHLRVTKFRFGNEELVEDTDDASAELLELGLDPLEIIADSANVLIGAFGLFILFDRRYYTLGGMPGTDGFLVRFRE